MLPLTTFANKTTSLDVPQNAWLTCLSHLDWCDTNRCDFICVASPCGLYYKHLTIVNDDSSAVSKWSFNLIDDPRVIIYDRHRFKIQATVWPWQVNCWQFCQQTLMRIFLWNWGLQWSQHAWVQFDTDLLRVANGFIYTEHLARSHID